MHFLLNLSLYVKNYWHFCHILPLFTMSTHQIWSYHLKQVTNLEKKINFFLILHLILGKSRNSMWKSSLLQKLEAKNLMDKGGGGGGWRKHTQCLYKL